MGLSTRLLNRYRVYLDGYSPLRTIKGWPYEREVFASPLEITKRDATEARRLLSSWNMALQNGEVGRKPHRSAHWQIHTTDLSCTVGAQKVNRGK